MRFATAVIALMLGLAGCSSTSAPAPPSSTAALAPPTASTMPAAPESPDASVDGTPTAAPDLASQFREILGTDFNGSALVSRDGDLLFAEGIGMADDANGIPNTPKTRFRLGSVTKQFTAMAVLMLASQGLLKTTDPAVRLRGHVPRRMACGHDRAPAQPLVGIGELHGPAGV